MLPDKTPGTEPIVTRYRSAAQNLRTTFEKIIRRAGLEPWEKLFQNFRSTRETELAESFPIHVVCAWLGNTQAVATKHYRQVTEEHFDRAAESTPEKAARKQAQSAAVSGRKSKDSESGAPENCRVISTLTNTYDVLNSPTRTRT